MEALKFIIVILFILFGIFLLFTSDQKIINYIEGLFSDAQKEEVTFNNVVMSLDSRNIFTNANFHSVTDANVSDIVQIPGSINLFYAIANGTIFYSNDYGTNWYPVSLPKTLNQNIVFYRLYVNNQKPYEISALAAESEKVSLYRTTNGFITMEKIYEINNKTFNDLSKGKNISVMLPVDGRIIIGTSK